MVFVLCIINSTKNNVRLKKSCASSCCAFPKIFRTVLVCYALVLTGSLLFVIVTSCCAIVARLAQSVEHETLNLRVVGSSPTLGDNVEEIATPLVLLSSGPGGDLPRSWGFS